MSEYHAMGAASGAFLLRKGDYVLHHYVGYDDELYDVATDPNQTKDLAHDPAYRETLATLLAEIESICNPTDVDAQAKADQAALVERFGGPAVAATLGTPGETPPPAV